MRTMLYEAAQSMMHSKRWSLLQGVGHADRQAPRDEKGDRGSQRNFRRLAVIMHRLWVDGTEFRWTREPTAAAA